MQVINSTDIVINNTNSTMVVLENGILHNIYHAGILLEKEDIQEIEKGYYSLEDPKPMKIIQEMDFGVSMTPEARKYGAEHSPDLNGVAYVIKDLAQRLLIRFYIAMWKRSKPVKVFNSFDEALEWLNHI